MQINDAMRRWEERYKEREKEGRLVKGREPNPFLVEAVHPLKPGRALDLGCGTGRHTIWLAENGWTAIGVDGAPTAIKAAEEEANELLTPDARHRAFFKLGNALEFALKDPVDLVVISYVHTDQLEALMATAFDNLREGGKLVMVGHDIVHIGYGPEDPDILYSVERLRKYGLAAGFKVDRVMQQTRREDQNEVTDTVAVMERPAAER